MIRSKPNCSPTAFADFSASIAPLPDTTVRLGHCLISQITDHRESSDAQVQDQAPKTSQMNKIGRRFMTYRSKPINSIIQLKNTDDQPGVSNPYSD
jgi:hypothetical protein